jgi:excisionase family DNA binding protein
MVSNMPEKHVRDTEWVTPAEAAAALGVTTKTLVRLSARGDIRAIRPGGTQRRYAAADVEAILAREPWDAA